MPGVVRTPSPKPVPMMKESAGKSYVASVDRLGITNPLSITTDRQGYVRIPNARALALKFYVIRHVLLGPIG